MATTRTQPITNGNGAYRRPTTSLLAVGETAKATARNRTRIIAGVLVIVVSALVTGLLYVNIGGRHAVVAIARPVAVGQVIQEADLRETLAGSITGVRTTPWGQRSTVVGKTAAVSLVAGSLLNPAQLTTGPVVDPADAIIGAVLKPGQFPASLRLGDRVLAIVLPADGTPLDEADLAPIVVTVAGIESVADSGGGLSVSLAAPPRDAPMLAVAGARGRLALVLAPR